MPPRFQACIYWRKSVNWRHQLQPSIFSMVMSLFHGSTWSNPYVKDTVFISQHFLQSSKVRIYSKELVSMIFVWKVMCLMHESTCSHSPPWSPDIGDDPRPNLQILGKTQTRVFPIPGFLVNLLYKKTVIIPEPAMILTWNLDP